MLPAILGYLVTPTGFAIATTAALLVGQSVMGLSFSNEDNSGSAYIHLDTTKNIPLSPQESSAGFTSVSNGIKPPATLPRYYAYTTSAIPSMPTGAGTLCTLFHTPTAASNNAQYQSVLASEWGDGAISPIASNAQSLNYASGWTTTGGTCRSAGTGPNDSLYLVQTSPCPYASIVNGSNNCVPSDLSVTSNVRKPADSICKVFRNGNTFTVSPNDPDCSDPAISPTFSNSNGTLSIVDTSNPRRFASVSLDSAGRATVISQVPVLNSDTNTKTTATVEAVAANGVAAGHQVTGQKTETAIGTGTNATTAPTGVSVTLPKIEFPENLAKTADVNAVKDAVVALNAPPSQEFDPLKFTAYTDKISALTTTFTNQVTQIPTNLFSFNLPISLGTVACEPYNGFSLMGQTITLDFCRWIELFRTYFGILLYMLTPFVIYSILLSTFGVYVHKGDDSTKDVPNDNYRDYIT